MSEENLTPKTHKIGEIFNWDYITEHILSFLPKKDLIKLNLVNKLFYNNTSCRNIFVENCETKDLFNAFKNSFGIYTKLTIGNNVLISPSTKWELPDNIKITHVQFNVMNLEFLQYLIENLKYLTHIYFNFDDTCFNTLGVFFENIQKKGIIFNKIKKFRMNAFELICLPKKEIFSTMFPVLEELLVDTLMIRFNLEIFINNKNDYLHKCFKFNECFFDLYDYKDNDLIIIQVWNFVKTHRLTNNCRVSTTRIRSSLDYFFSNFEDFNFDLYNAWNAKLPVSILPKIKSYKFQRNLTSYDYMENMLNLKKLFINTSECCFFSHNPIKTKPIDYLIICIHNDRTCFFCLTSLIASLDEKIIKIILCFNQKVVVRSWIVERFKNKFENVILCSKKHFYINSRGEIA